MTVKDYLDLLKSDAPAPGGGSVSALTAAQGIGLVGMVAALTIGKERSGILKRCASRQKRRRTRSAKS